MSLSLVAYDSSEGSEDEGNISTRTKPEEDSAPQAIEATNGSKLLTSLPAPKSQPSFSAISSLLFKKDKNGKAMIAMPVAPDSDSDDDGPPSKKKKKDDGKAPVQVGKSALMSMLPQPKNLFQKAKISTGEASSVGTITSQEGDAMRAKNKNMPTKKSTASLTPYVLGKKKEAVPIDTSRKSAIAKKPAATAKGEEDEDGEEESTPFFSFHSAKDDEALLAQDKATSEAGSIPTAYATTVEQRTAHQVCAGASEAASSTSSWPSAACSEQYVGPATGPMPAEYSYGATAQEPDYPATGPSLEPSAHSYPAYDSTSADPPPAYQVAPAESQQVAPDSLGDLLNDEQFKRLSRGGKRNKQDLAAIASSMVDFDENERASSYNALPSKYMSEEKAVRAPQSAQPSRAQKNKHQITYLAFQAKERELELQNQWSQNRQTKKQTQSKYGF